MSELSFDSQEPETVPYCHDCPPQYELCQPSQDVLTSVIENEHARRTLLKRINCLATEFLDNFEKKNPTDTDYALLMELFLNMNRSYTEITQMGRELANVYKERIGQNTELYTALTRLTVSEFERTYASLRRDPNRQIRHELAQDHKDCGNCYDRSCGYISQRSLGTKQMEKNGDSTCDSPCSYDNFFELSAKIDEINDKLCQSTQSKDTASVSKTTDDAPAKPPRSFWRTIFKHSVRL
ncbi:uncharacterized protein N7477_001651 [Penicillium maclennaniae]|uniref:uncharacterized protein n=1 Tax=Penicillium maclennaniae TaxID=1343394 RepID=UPI00253F8A43|nr:uncharacterized protein N7477_001651 [Penicillium maclennaniae]KAJ5681711.1 hypothetical protein N7477_001651 [Penicillium maclennaniae]